MISQGEVRWQLVTVDKGMLTERVGRIRKQKLELVLAGIDIILGR